MDEKKRVDHILDVVKDRLKEEVGLLLGTELSVSASASRIVSKEQFLDDLSGKQIFAKVDLSGELEGLASLVVGIKAAIYLGGTLIMLPQNELEKFVQEEDYTEELADSYGEIANIIVGVYTKTFEEMYPREFRFIRKELELLAPTKIDVSSAEPFPDDTYYLVNNTLALGENDLGELSFLLPAALFGLLDAEADADSVKTVAQDVEASAGQTASAVTASDEPQPVSSGTDPRQLEKQKRRIDKVLVECGLRMQSEIGALLGSEITLEDLGNKFIDKETFFLEEVTGKQVLANMDVVGDLEGKGFFVISLHDAIYTGGLLIMLPESELEKMVAEENFSEDIADAYGEIANIVSGGYTGVFEEQYAKKLHFIRKEVYSVVPLKVASEDDTSVPDLGYYVSSMTLHVAGEQRGRVHMLIPAELLGLEMPEEAGAEPAMAAQASAPQPKKREPLPESLATPAAENVSFQPADILLVSDDDQVAELVGQGAAAKGLSVRRVSVTEDVRAALTPEIKAIYLVMREVTEQAFGVAITLRGVSTLPLVAAGPEWTRSKVIRAAKYGISDILLTPATADHVSENLEKHLQRKAA